MRQRPVGEVLDGPGRSGRRHPRRGPRVAALRRARHRLGARRHGRDRRERVVAVHLGAAAGGCALRRRRRHPPRRQAGPLAPPHRDDDRDAPRPRGRGRRRRRQPLGRRTRARSAALDDAIEPDLSNAAPFLALAATTGGIHHHPRLAAPRTTQPGDALRDVLTQMGCEVTLGDDGLTVTGHRRPSTASTSTCTTSASSRRRSPPSARWPTRPRTCAASATSATTRPTGWPRSRPSSATSAPTSPSTPTDSRSGPLPCTAAPSGPTPTTGWRTPA